MLYNLIAKAAPAASPDRQRKRLGAAVAPRYTVGEIFGPALHRARSAIRWAVSKAFRGGFGSASPLVMCSYGTAATTS